MTGATEVWVALWNEVSNRWLLSVDDDLVPLEEAAARGLIPLSVFRYAERTAEPLVTEDASQDARFAKDPYFSGVSRCSLLAVPILSRAATRALVVLENQLSRNAFAGNRLDNVLLIAGQLAVSVDNALLYASLERKVAERTEALAVANQRLETLSVTDSLTGLANRRRLADVLDLEWQRALRPGTPLGLAMIDIDYFKAFNDLYGHPAGDHCLRRVAAALNETVRATDLVARYGGEEFAAVMPGVNLVGAKRISERMRAAVMALRQPHEQSPLGVVTISVGVAATVPSRSGLPTQLIDLADHLLYEAKNHGRNQVAFA
jgi:diguanylate cyclase (GGDEF)-like protein